MIFKLSAAISQQCKKHADEYELTQDQIAASLRLSLKQHIMAADAPGIAGKKPPITNEKRKQKYRRKPCERFHKIYGDL
jgi:hypothetical protein